MNKHITIFALLFLSSLSLRAAELFVRINAPGMFFASAGSQTHYNNSNTFRFFDLSEGNIELKIVNTANNMSFYTGTLNIGYNQRMVVELDKFANLRVIQTEQISYVNWYTSSSNQSTFIGNNNGNFNNQQAAYQAFLEMLDNETFDSKKLEISKKYIDKTTLSAAEIAGIAKKFEYDSNRLEWAKYAYKNCYDKANYFMLKPVFEYTTNYMSLEDFIEKQ